ncbi:MAG: MBL fold metallo-hydrolase [Planctomycetota bacterium]
MPPSAASGRCRSTCTRPRRATAATPCSTSRRRWACQGDTVELADATWRVVHAPGHSPGGVLYVHDASKQAIVGDTLFAGSIGRIDFPTSDPQAMRHTIQHVLMGLPDDLTVYPGHGPATTIGEERRTNPFVVHGF